MPELKKPVHNTASRNYIKLDSEDYRNIESFLPSEEMEEYKTLSDSERVTCERVRLIIQFIEMKKQRQS